MPVRWSARSGDLASSLAESHGRAEPESLRDPCLLLLLTVLAKSAISVDSRCPHRLALRANLRLIFRAAAPAAWVGFSDEWR